MKRRVEAQKKNDDQEELKRQRRLVLGGVGAGLFLIATGIGFSLRNAPLEETPSVADNSTLNPAGEPLKGGEIITEPQLINAYVNAIGQHRPMEIDPTIIRSTFFNAMTYFSLDKDSALKRANYMFTAQTGKGNCPETFCTYAAPPPWGVAAELTNKFFNGNTNIESWVALLVDLAHEAYHATSSVNGKTYPYTEDYGFLGQLVNKGSHTGFSPNLEEFRGDKNLNFFDRNIYIENSNRFYNISIFEEFLAEWGKIRYLNHLLANGLEKSPEMATFKDGFLGLIAYPNFTQSLVDIFDPVWQNYWTLSNQMKPEIIDNLHRFGKQFEFFFALGNIVLNQNNQMRTASITPADRAGIGVLAFTDFITRPIGEEIENSLLYFLANQAYSPKTLTGKARELSAKLTQIGLPPTI